MIICKDIDLCMVVLLLFVVYKYGVCFVKGGGSLCGLCCFWVDLCIFYDFFSFLVVSWKESWWIMVKKRMKMKEDGVSWGLYVNL